MINSGEAKAINPELESPAVNEKADIPAIPAQDIADANIEIIKIEQSFRFRKQRIRKRTKSSRIL